MGSLLGERSGVDLYPTVPPAGDIVKKLMIKLLTIVRVD
jgi:hypothetical protein